MSCCMMSSHRFFCHPRLRHPLTSAIINLFMEFSSSLLITVLSSHHHNLASCILSVMHAFPSVFLMTSFSFLSFSETPSIHRSILISVLSSSPSSLLVTVQASAPYISTSIPFLLDILAFLHHTKHLLGLSTFAKLP